MPTRLYRPVRERTTPGSRVLVHEWKFALVAYVWTSIGAVLCWTWVASDGPTTVISELAAPAAGVVSVALLVSGVGILAAILVASDRLSWCLEMPALVLGASAWIAYLTVSDSLIWRIVASGYVIGCTLRLLDSLMLLVRRWRKSRRGLLVVPHSAP